MKIEQAVKLALKLMKKHGLEKWTLVLDNSKSYAGYVIHKEKHIGLSRFFLQRDNKFEVQDTVLHEIAHALLPEGTLHSKEWKELAKKIGAYPSYSGKQHYRNKTFKK